MTTITTKQLRENMGRVIQDLQKGKAVQLSYRHKVIGSLQPVTFAGMPSRRGSARSVQNFLNIVDFGPTSEKLKNSDISIKDQLAKLRSRDLSLK